MKRVKTLSQLLPGESGIIEAFTDSLLSVRLNELGCLPGTVIRMGKSAPLGDPVMVTVSGACLSMRKSEASTILLRTPSQKTADAQ
ncbi:MAG: ferrous iron transport protein A [Flavobacteriales bacterium]|nr:ferrous iron transport protein A [Flavobacteriales bacterium]MCB9449145.1 ferrous iron transport protein A [Flavobacteriales bacterium]